MELVNVHYMTCDLHATLKLVPQRVWWGEVHTAHVTVDHDSIVTEHHHRDVPGSIPVASFMLYGFGLTKSAILSGSANRCSYGWGSRFSGCYIVICRGLLGAGVVYAHSLIYVLF